MNTLPMHAPTEPHAASLSALPTASTEQEAFITDALYRTRWVEVNPRYELGMRLVQSLLPPLLFFQFVDWYWLAAWELAWVGSLAIGVVMARAYRRDHRAVPPPQALAKWRRRRVLHQALGWVLTGLVPLFCFQLDSVAWEIAAVAGTVMILVYAPVDSAERGEVIAAALSLTAPLIVTLLLRQTPLHYTLAILTTGMALMLMFWGIHQVGSYRNEILMRLVLQEEKRKAEEANVAKSRFLAAASHDLRQPLHALGLFVEALSGRVENPETQPLFTNIRRSVSALEGLFNALLDISKLDAGTVEPRVTDMMFAPLLAHLSAEYEPQVRARGLDWYTEGGELALRTDGALLETILRNLISNAMRYTEQGRVSVICRREGMHAVIEVRDTGVGIPPEFQREVFREFYQLQNPERDRSKGLGLGLAIVDRLVRLLGHGLLLESKPGAGSVFRLRLPLGEVTMVPQELPPELITMSANNLRVLVIDDEASVRDAMLALLEDWGYQVVVVGSLEEALALAEARVPDAIIADYRLREECTGAEAIRALHQHYAVEIPALIVTGDTAPERIAQARASGFAFLHKPVQPAKLRAFLRNAARRGHAAETAH